MTYCEKAGNIGNKVTSPFPETRLYRQTRETLPMLPVLRRLPEMGFLKQSSAYERRME